jgi:NAD(P)H-dependent flavin oxidoreductase YrpB (nitropropane dioxygenase family)
MFNSKYPIVCAPMNAVSDLKLALACQQAGIVPSLVPYTYASFKEFFEALSEYKKTQGDIVVALRFSEVVDARLTNKLMTSGITHIELLDYEPTRITEENIVRVNELRANGVQIILKVLTHTYIEPYKDIIDAVTVKGPEGAGRSMADLDLIEEIKIIKSIYPTIKIIASGGIKNSYDIKRHLSAGADAVGIGTLFAMSKESSIPKEVKDKLMLSTSGDIRRLQSGAQQRAVIFKESTNDDFNNTQGLNQGLKTGTQGHVFVGNAIDSITEILSVEEIVKALTL